MDKLNVTMRFWTVNSTRIIYRSFYVKNYGLPARKAVRDPAKNALSIGSVSTILPRTISRVPSSVFGILPAQNIGIPWKFLSNVSFSLKESNPVVVNIIKMFLLHNFALPFHYKYTLMTIEKCLYKCSTC
jgi:hypothetical protein